MMFVDGENVGIRWHDITATVGLERGHVYCALLHSYVRAISVLSPRNRVFP